MLEGDKHYTEMGRRLNWKEISIAVVRHTIPFPLRVSLNAAISKQVEIKLRTYDSVPSRMNLCNFA
jgi:hypothetical protein